MLTELLTALGQLASLGKKVFDWRWGDQTKKEASIEADGDRALTAARSAQTADALNAADAELQRVHDRAQSTRGE